MPFDPESLITDCATLLGTVAGITANGATVSTYRREVRNESDAAAKWIPVGGTTVHAWNVTLGEPTANSTRNAGFNDLADQPGRVLSDIGIAIEGVHGISDSDTPAQASEVIFRAIGWSVVKAFNRRGKIAPYVTHQNPLQWERFGYLLLAGMYHVHYAKMRISFIGQVFP